MILVLYYHSLIHLSFFPFFKQQNKRDTTWWGVCSKKACLKDKNHYDAEGAAMIFVSSLD